MVVQSYNAVLSLARLLESTDALLALHNDEAHEICEVSGAFFPCRASLRWAMREIISHPRRTSVPPPRSASL